MPEILNTTPVATSRLFSIEQVDLRFSNGTEACFERLVGEGEGAVMVVPMHTDQELILIREYAVGVERYELSFVKGRIDSERRRSRRHTANSVKKSAAMLPRCRDWPQCR